MINSIDEGTYVKRGGEQSGDPWQCDEQFLFSEVHPPVSPIGRIAEPCAEQHNLSYIHTWSEKTAKRLQLEWYRQILRPQSGVSLKVRLFLSCLHNNKSVRERILPNSACVPGTTQPLLLWLANGPATALIPQQWWPCTLRTQETVTHHLISTIFPPCELQRFYLVFMCLTHCQVYRTDFKCHSMFVDGCLQVLPASV